MFKILFGELGHRLLASDDAHQRCLDAGLADQQASARQMTKDETNELEKKIFINKRGNENE